MQLFVVGFFEDDSFAVVREKQAMHLVKLCIPDGCVTRFLYNDTEDNQRSESDNRRHFKRIYDFCPTKT